MGHKILLIDDDAATEHILRRFLGKVATPYTLDAVTTAKDALPHLINESYDAYLIDYRLDRGHQGTNLILEARRRGCRQAIILLTGFGSDVVDRLAQESGADDYIDKNDLSPPLIDRAVRYAIGRRETQRKLAERQASLAHAMRLAELGQLAAGISHEICNPLAVVIGQSALVDSHLRSPSTIRPEYLIKANSKIDLAARKIHAIVKTLRDYARDETIDDPVPVDTKNLVTQALTIAGPKLMTDRVDVTTRIEGDPPPVPCREGQITQILVNLIVNASDAAKGSEDRSVEIQLEHFGETFEFAVTDSGRGIPLGIRPRILDPFFTTKPRGMGTGLGLSISRALAESHGGRLFLDESSEKTRFVLQLPTRIVPAEPSESLKIIVADDDEAVRELLREELTTAGHEVSCARDAVELLQLTATEDPDNIITDFQMPGLAGTELIERLAEVVGDTRRLVVITGHDQTSLPKWIAKDIKVLQKPFDPSELIESLKRRRD